MVFFILQFGQAFYGFFFSAEVALFGYLYAMVEEKEFYQKITGHARAATLTGKFFSSCLSQILATTYGVPPYNALVYMSIAGKYNNCCYTYYVNTFIHVIIQFLNL